MTFLVIDINIMSRSSYRWTMILLIAVSSGACGAADLTASVSHNCDRPYDITVTIKNSTQRTIIIGRSSMPFWPRGSGVGVVARVFKDGSSVSIPATGMIMDTRPDEVVLGPNKSMANTFNLGAYYRLDGLESKAKIFYISFPESISYKTERYALSAPVVSIYVAGSRFWSTACPTITVRSRP